MTLQEWAANAATPSVAPTRQAMQEAMQRLWEQCKARENETYVFALDTSGNPRRNGQLFSISRDTYLFWRAGMGNSKARRRWRRRSLPNTQQVNATCKLCGGGIGPDITNRPMCYGCGPREMRP